MMTAAETRQWLAEADELLVDIGRVIGKHERNGELIDEVINNVNRITNTSGANSDRESAKVNAIRP